MAELKFCYKFKMLIEERMTTVMVGKFKPNCDFFFFFERCVIKSMKNFRFKNYNYFIENM